MTVTPLLLMSLPRSGSTMLQRSLARHPKIATCSEPWFVLGLLAPSTVEIGGTNYGFKAYREAVEDVIELLPNGQKDWNGAMRLAALELYQKLACRVSNIDDVVYFLDKTPRYSLAPDAVVDMFPGSPIIVLWRNPLSIVSSMMSTWSNGRWNLYRFYQDLYISLPKLVDFVEANPGRAFTIQYEQVLTDEEGALLRIYSFLGLAQEELDSASLIELTGRMGDPTGGLNRKANFGEDVRWKAAFSNPLRRYWARRYLAWLGPDRLSVMGYDMNHLVDELESCRGFSRHLLSDLILIPRGFLRNIFAWPIVKSQLKRFFSRVPPLDLE